MSAAVRKSRRQEAVAKILADPKLNGNQKARKISNLIKMTVGGQTNVKSTRTTE